MKKKKTLKKTQSTMSSGTDCLVEDVDRRPESSPYETSSVKLHFDDGTISIPSSLLSKYPKLSPFDSWDHTVRLETTRDIGHVLVHYLFTDKYQCLKPKTSSPLDQSAVEFTTSVRVYALCRDYEVSPLEELAKREIERLGSGMSFSMILDLVRGAYPEPRVDDAWIESYLKAGLKSIFQNPSELMDCGTSIIKRETLSMSDLLFKNLVELVCEHANLMQDLGTAPCVEALEECVTPESRLGLPTEPEHQDRVFWAREEQKKGKALNPVPETEPEPEPEPGLEPEPKPGPDAEDDSWVITSSKKKKKKKYVFEPEPEPEPEFRKQEDDSWAPITSAQKARKKKRLLPPPEPAQEDVILTTAEVVGGPTDTVATSVVRDEWVCMSDNPELKSETDCGRQTEHISGDGLRLSEDAFITEDNVNKFKYTFRPGSDITDSVNKKAIKPLGGRLGFTSMTTTYPGKITSESVMITNAVIEYRENGGDNYGVTYVSVGLPATIVDKFIDGGRASGITLANKSRTKLFNNRYWIDAKVDKLKKENISVVISDGETYHNYNDSLLGIMRMSKKNMTAHVHVVVSGSMITDNANANLDLVDGTYKLGVSIIEMYFKDTTDIKGPGLPPLNLNSVTKVEHVHALLAGGELAALVMQELNIK